MIAHFGRMVLFSKGSYMGRLGSWIDTTPSLTLRYGPIGALARRVSPPRFTSQAPVP
jgi:hypothetical protein